MANETQFLLYNMPEPAAMSPIYSDGELSPDTTVAKIATVVNNKTNRKFSAFSGSVHNLKSFKIECFRICKNAVKALRRVTYSPRNRDRNGTKMTENGRFLAI